MDATRRSHTGTWLLFMLMLVAPLHDVECLEPVSLTIAAASAVALTSYASHRLYCRLTQRCDEEKPFSTAALNADLTNRLFGQPLAKAAIIWALTDFMGSEYPQKALTLSLHGWTGTGKNLASKIIVENIYKLGMKSKCVHLYVSTLHFPHEDRIPLYQDQLHTWIRGNVSRCARSIFIFDEMEKLSPDLIDAIKPFLNYYEHIDGVSFHKAIFIFLSNAGNEQINEDVVKIAMERHSLQLYHLESIFSTLFSNRILWHRSLIGNSLIDFSIPFLPLELGHVKRCIMAELRQSGLREDEELASRVANEMVYFPKDRKLFSDRGCKTIPAKLLIHL
ncbi:torsin-1A-like [Pseudophryne corroboree]|uniref:torsin-1A-like n=1 Tax=Pseudophryne corroboree TaxID=495146 RepID=UPI003081C6BD